MCVCVCVCVFVCVCLCVCVCCSCAADSVENDERVVSVIQLTVEAEQKVQWTVGVAVQLTV